MLGLFWWILRMPPWTVIEMRRTLEIRTKNGNLASLTKRATLRANQQGLTGFMHRRIRADGSIRNFRFNSEPVPPGDIYQDAGEYTIYERFIPTRRWQKIESCLVYDLIDSFPTSPQCSIYHADYFTKKFILEIHFPVDRPARNPRAFSGYGAETEYFDSPTLSANGLTIHWERYKLKPGKFYTVEWDW